jgi:UDPglucose 6-dehydrogenase
MAPIYVIGLWHQGLVACSVLAEYASKVIGIADSAEQAAKLNSGMLPVFEPGLSNGITTALKSKNLKFMPKDLVGSLADATVLVTHDTKVDVNDQSDMGEFFDDVDWILSRSTDSTHVLISAQVPVGTFSYISSKYSNAYKNFQAVVSVTPENLRLGQAISRFRNPPLPVIGCAVDSQAHWVDFFSFMNVKFEFCSQTEAELLKHALNGYLAMNIAYGNEIDRLARSYGFSGSEIIRMLEIEPRVGNLSPKRPGLPFFGGTLARDLVTLKNVTEELSLKAPLLNNILESNERHKDYSFQLIASYLDQREVSLRVCILGLTYTAGTSTLRQSPGLWLASELRQLGHQVSYLDPRIDCDVLDLERVENVEDLKMLSFDVFILLMPWSGFEEVLSYVGSIAFIDIEGKLLKSKIELPKNYLSIY